MSDSEIPCGPLRVTWHEGPLRVVLERDGARLTLSPEPATARGPWIVGRGRVKGRAGPAQRLELQHPRGDAPGVRFVIEVPEDGSGVVVELRPERGAAAASLVMDPAAPGRDPAALDGFGFRSGPLAGLVTRLDPGPPPAASAGPGSSLRVAAAGEDAPGRLWVGLGAAGADLEANAVARLAAEREVTPPGRGAVTGPGAHDLGYAPVGVRGPADEAPPDGAWRVGRGTPRGADIGRVEAWEPSDPLRRLAGAGQLWQLAFRLDPKADPEELRTQASLAGLAGGLAHIETVSAPVPAEARAILRRCLPPLARAPRLATSGVLVTPLIGTRIAVAFWNDADGPRSPVATWEQLGLAGPHHAVDFWQEADLGLRDGSLAAGPLEPGSCRVIALTAPASRPQVVGTTLHVGMGTIEVAALRQESEGRRLVLRLAGAHRGRVFVAEADGGRVAAHDIAFEDAAERLLPVAGPDAAPGS